MYICGIPGAKVRINERKTKKNLFFIFLPSESSFGEAKGTDIFLNTSFIQNNSVILQKDNGPYQFPNDI